MFELWQAHKLVYKIQTDQQMIRQIVIFTNVNVNLILLVEVCNILSYLCELFCLLI